MTKASITNLVSDQGKEAHSADGLNSSIIAPDSLRSSRLNGDHDDDDDDHHDGDDDTIAPEMRRISWLVEIPADCEAHSAEIASVDEPLKPAPGLDAEQERINKVLNVGPSC